HLNDGKVLLKVPLLPIALQDDFLKEHDQDAFTKGLIGIDFLLQSPEDTFYMAFEITGNAMDNGTSHSIPNGALVLAKKVDKFKLHKDKGIRNKAFVMMCTDRIICKSITDISMDTGTIMCHNLNPSPEFKDFEIQITEVGAIYEVLKKQV
ncbi:MAG: hypothetical protein AAF039_18200, partial [Bacteroidota bacterium]